MKKDYSKLKKRKGIELAKQYYALCEKVSDFEEVNKVTPLKVFDGQVIKKRKNNKNKSSDNDNSINIDENENEMLSLQLQI